MREDRSGPGSPSLRYIGLGDSSGYAVAAAALVRALRDDGVNVVWEPMLPGGALGLGYAPATSPDAGPADLRALRDDGRRCDDVIIHFVPEYYPHFIARERALGASRIIGHCVWETDRLPAHWPALINQLDAVIVPTEWNRQVFRDSGVGVPILVAPHLPRFLERTADPAERDRLLASLPDLAGRYVFYTISTWLERKGIAPLVEAFAEAFGRDDPVALVIKTTPFDLERVRRDPGHEGQPVAVVPQFEAMIGRAVLRHRRLPPPIHLLTDTLSDSALHALHERGDCFVSLCRAEGWGLGAFEAAWLGKPVIITGWGGPAAFLSAETAYFVDWSPAPVRPAEPNASYTPDQNWVEPDIASAMAALRAVVADPGEAVRRGTRAAAHLRQTIVPEDVVRGLLREIGALPSHTPDGSGEPPSAEEAVAPPPDTHPAAGVAPPSERATLTGRILRSLLFREGSRFTDWLRETLLLDRQGRLRPRARMVLYEKGDQPRAIAATWLRDHAAEQEMHPEERYDRRMRQWRESGELARARQVRVLTARGNRAIGQRIASSLSRTRLTCRLASRLSLSFTDDLYVVVDPLDFRLMPPAERTICFLNRLDPHAVDGDMVAFLARGLGVLAAAPGIIAALRKHGMPTRQIYFAADRLADDGAGPSSFWGLQNLLPRALHGLGILDDEEYEAATASFELPSETLVLCLPEYPDRFENARRNLLPGAALFPGLRQPVAWQGCAASYRFLARHALAKQKVPLTIYEDDATLEPDVGARLAAIRGYLDSLDGRWDIFSGLISDLSEASTVSRVEDWRGERLATLNSVVGLVFSILNRHALECLARFSVEGNNLMAHTIDRHLERQDLICITPARPLVTHSCDFSSTLWVRASGADPFSPAANDAVSPSIAASQDRLRRKIQACAMQGEMPSPEISPAAV